MLHTYFVSFLYHKYNMMERGSLDRLRFMQMKHIAQRVLFKITPQGINQD